MKPTSVPQHRLTIPVKTKGDGKTLASLLEDALGRDIRQQLGPHVGPVRRWDLTVWVQDFEMNAVKALLGTRAFGMETHTS